MCTILSAEHDRGLQQLLVHEKMLRLKYEGSLMQISQHDTERGHTMEDDVQPVQFQASHLSTQPSFSTRVVDPHLAAYCTLELVLVQHQERVLYPQERLFAQFLSVSNQFRHLKSSI